MIYTKRGRQTDKKQVGKEGESDRMDKAKTVRNDFCVSVTCYPSFTLPQFKFYSAKAF